MPTSAKAASAAGSAGRQLPTQTPRPPRGGPFVRRPATPERRPKAVGKLYELIDRDKGVEPGRASLVRTALEYAYGASVYSDVIERLKIVEENQIEAAKQ